MASYKLKPEFLSLNNQRFPSSNSFSLNNRPSLNLYQHQSSSEHKLIINEINMKNQALKGYHLHKQHNPTHPNYLTFCQQYTQMLCHKYNPQHAPNSIPPNRSQESYKQKTFNQQLEQKMSLNFIAYRRYFQTVQFNFDKDYQNLMMKLKQLTQILYTRNSAFAKKDQQVDEELLIMELFMNKINIKISKENTKITSYFITPFTMFFEDMKKSTTPERGNSKKKRQTQLNYEQKDFIKDDNKLKEQQKQKASKTRSFIVSSNTPEMLLHSFNQQFNKSKEQRSSIGQNNQSNQMFVSFKQQANHYLKHNYSCQASNKIKTINGRRDNKNSEGSQLMGDTLKYSESEMMGNQLNINLGSRSVDLQQSSMEQNDLNADDVPFSPVQPYRLHKLYNEANIKKLDRINLQNTHKTDELEQELFIDKQNQALFKQTLGLIQNSMHTSIEPLKLTSRKLSLALSQTLTDVSQIITQSRVLVNEEKLFLNQDWEEVLKFISKDIEELQDGLTVEKQQNDIKDKKFLQNLQIVQNELIEQIFEEKESRKAQQNVLTQVLTNLVQNLENGYD